MEGEIVKKKRFDKVFKVQAARLVGEVPITW